MAWAGGNVRAARPTRDFRGGGVGTAAAGIGIGGG